MTYAELSNFLSSAFNSSLLPVILHYFIPVSPILMAVGLTAIFCNVWMRYVRLKNFNSIKYTLLELKLPKDTFKSPLAMETVLHALHNTSDGSEFAQLWKGETRPWYSLEIMSVEGEVKFMIWTEDRRKNNLMSALYSQYPGIEISEQEDYAKSVQFDPKVWKIWASEFAFTKANPYPIKTYVDYGLDKDPKEEFKIDPLTHLIEWLGSLRPNEQAWFQFVVRAHKKDQKKPGTFWTKADLYREETAKEIDKLLMRDPKSKFQGTEEVQTNPDGTTKIVTKRPLISGGEQDIVTAIERKLTKLPFDVCVRALYIAKRSSFDTPFGIGGCISSMKQFNAEHLNGFKPGGKQIPGQLDYPWEDYKDTKRNYYSKRVLMAYRRRSAFYPPYKSKTMVMNTEELATIYHFPGSVAATPSLDRVPSKKGTAPGNLPV
ncbi:MAG: hypothetical protein JWO00_654 [Candidatus Parcubacteria bacterium]|nr:hypothetical protein [Candidatus Parcubacteria bacterium]